MPTPAFSRTLRPSGSTTEAALNLGTVLRKSLLLQMGHQGRPRPPFQEQVPSPINAGRSLPGEAVPVLYTQLHRITKVLRVNSTSQEGTAGLKLALAGPKKLQDNRDQLHEASWCAELKREGPLHLLLHGKNLPAVFCALMAFTRGYTAWPPQPAFSATPLVAEGTLKVVFKQCVTQVLREVTKHSSIAAIQQGLLCWTRR